MDENGQIVSKAADLDDLAQKLLATEIANPFASTRELMEIAGLTCNRKTAHHRRRSLAYQRALSGNRADALRLLTDLEAMAIRSLEKLLRCQDPSIRLRAAQTLASGVLEYRRQEIKAKLDQRSLAERSNASVTVKLDYGDLAGDEKLKSNLDHFLGRKTQ